MAAQIEGMEWIVILVVLAALFLFGPQKLPELARGIGRAAGEFRKARLQVDREIKEEYDGVHERVRELEDQVKVK